MPFQPPWRELSKGDLVFGVDNDEKSIGKGAFMKRKPGGVGMTEYPICNIESLFSRNPEPANHEGFKTALRGHSKYSQSIGADDSNEAFRWKCKGGLYWATMVDQDVHVHFVLDDLNETGVVKKGALADQSTGGAKKRGVTGSELRWIYRNRDKPGVQGKVQFWRNDAPCEPPWVTNKKLWSQYKPKSLQVHHDAGGGPQQNKCCVIF